MALKDDGVGHKEGTIRRKQAVNILGMSDTEFALRLIWDAAFPKALANGAFREADVVAWKNGQRTGGAKK